MAITYNIYCDESSYMQFDDCSMMALGAIWCPKRNVKEFHKELRLIKEKHNLNHNFEIKWSKVSESKVDFYLDVIRFFFKEPNIYFRSVVIPDKSILNHEIYQQSHDKWYYKIYYILLKHIIHPDFNEESNFNIYLDQKERKNSTEYIKLHEILCNDLWDFSHDIVKKVQPVDSGEVGLIQLADLFTGVIIYANRGLTKNKGKTAVVQLVKELSGINLDKSTSFQSHKINLLFWVPKKRISL